MGAALSATAISPIAQHLQQKPIEVVQKPTPTAAPQKQGYDSAKFIADSSKQSWDRGKTLKAIAQQESNGGKNTAHREIENGLNAGGTAHGRYGLTDLIIKDVIQHSPRLSEKHADVQNMDNKTIDSYIHDNPDLEDDIAGRYHDRIVKQIGTAHPAAVYTSWLNGITGGKKYIEQHNPEEHPIASKVFANYNKIKN